MLQVGATFRDMHMQPCARRRAATWIASQQSGGPLLTAPEAHNFLVQPERVRINFTQVLDT
jgi:hypothetical protein